MCVRESESFVCECDIDLHTEVDTAGVWEQYLNMIGSFELNQSELTD